MSNITFVKSYTEKESEIEFKFKHSEPFWHICSPGEESAPLLFKTMSDFIFGMNLMGHLAATMSSFKILTFTLMSNHIHIIASCKESVCVEAFNYFKRRLQRYLRSKLPGFTHHLIPITNPNMLRNEIAYVNRNGFVINQNYTPSSYPWSSSAFFFRCDLWPIKSLEFNSLSLREKRDMLLSRNTDFPNTLKIYNGIIIPSSFCHITEAESYFHSAHEYFYIISKKLEAYSEISKRLGDRVFLSDEELFAAVLSIVSKEFGHKQIKVLSPEERIMTAIIMRKKYNSSNKQIMRILRLSSDTVNQLFPSTK